MRNGLGRKERWGETRRRGRRGNCSRDVTYERINLKIIKKMKIDKSLKSK